MPHRICTIDDCDKNARTRGLCQKHYSRLMRHGDPLYAKEISRSTPPADRIRLRTVASPDGCLLFTGGNPSRSGHRLIRYQSKSIGVHRLAWILANGPIEPGLCVCHRCDVPSCVNVEHLFLGTQADNTADRDAKGRHIALRGSKHGRAKLSEHHVIEIRRRAAAGEPQRALAAEYGVSQSLVWYAIHKGWKHIKPNKTTTLENT